MYVDVRFYPSSMYQRGHSFPKSLGTFVENELTMSMKVYLWSNNNDLWVCPVAGLHYIDQHSFIVSFETIKWKLTDFVLFQDCIGYSVSLDFNMNFRIYLPIYLSSQLSFARSCVVCRLIWRLLLF